MRTRALLPLGRFGTLTLNPHPHPTPSPIPNPNQSALPLGRFGTPTLNPHPHPTPSPIPNPNQSALPLGRFGTPTLNPHPHPTPSPPPPPNQSALPLGRFGLEFVIGLAALGLVRQAIPSPCICLAHAYVLQTRFALAPTVGASLQRLAHTIGLQPLAHIGVAASAASAARIYGCRR
jgi:hypothetical protein